MSRNGSGVYSLPAGSLVTNGDTGTASQHNTPLQDLETDMNTARPVVAGGTGATTAADARTNLEVPKAVYEDHTNNYRVIGTTLEQWGSTGPTDSNGEAAVSFNKTFDTVPFVTAICNQTPAGGASGYVVHLKFATIAVDGVTFSVRQGTSNAVGVSVTWYAIGDWDGVS